MKLNTAEKLEAEALKADGWTVHRNGWPDFMAEKDGVFRFIEVKRKPDRLSKNQKSMCKALFRLTGIKLEVRYYSKHEGVLKMDKLENAKISALLAWARKYHAK